MRENNIYTRKREIKTIMRILGQNTNHISKVGIILVVQMMIREKIGNLKQMW